MTKNRSRFDSLPVRHRLPVALLFCAVLASQCSQTEGPARQLPGPDTEAPADQDIDEEGDSEAERDTPSDGFVDLDGIEDTSNDTTPPDIGEDHQAEDDASDTLDIESDHPTDAPDHGPYDASDGFDIGPEDAFDAADWDPDALSDLFDLVDGISDSISDPSVDFGFDAEDQVDGGSPFDEPCPTPSPILTCRSSRPRITSLSLSSESAVDAVEIHWDRQDDSVTVGLQVQRSLEELPFEPLGPMLPATARTTLIPCELIPGQTYHVRIVPLTDDPLPGIPSPVETLTVPADDPSRPHLLDMVPETFPEPYGPGLHLTFDAPETERHDIEIQVGTDGETWPIELHTDPSLYQFRNIHGDLGAPGSACLEMYERCLPDGRRYFARARWDELGPWSNVVTGVVARYLHPRTFFSRDELDAMRVRFRTGIDLAQFRLWLGTKVAQYIDESVVLPAPYSDDPTHLQWGQKAFFLALYGLMTENDEATDKAAEILAAYADLLEGHTPSNTFNHGIVTTDQLLEALWVEKLAVAYDFVMAVQGLTTVEAERFQDNVLLLAAAQFDLRDLSNHQIWHLLARAAVGFALGDTEIIEGALSGSGDPDDCGWSCQISTAFHDEGLHWERSPNYEMFSLKGMLGIARMARTWRLDIERLSVPDLTDFDGDSGPRDLLDCLDAFWRQSLPGGYYPPWADTPWDCSASSLGAREVFRQAYDLYHDPVFSMLGLGTRSVVADDSLDHRPPWRHWTTPDWDPMRVTVRTCDPDATLPVIRMQPEPQPGVTRGTVFQDFELPQDSVDCLFQGRYRARDLDIGDFRLRVTPRPGGVSIYLLELGSAASWTDFEASYRPPAGTSTLRLEYLLDGSSGILDLTDLSVRCDGGDNILPNAELTRTSNLQNYGLLFIDYGDALPDPTDLLVGYCSGSFGATGLDSNSSTLADNSGRVILRSGEGDDGAAATLFYGPYGSGHGQPDMLSIAYAAGGSRALWMYGKTVPYETDEHRYWINSAVSHNVVVPDQRNQQPQALAPHGDWTSWPDPHGRTEHGQLLDFVTSETASRVRATDGYLPDEVRAYPGFILDRTVVLHRGVLADRMTADPLDWSEHTYEMHYHVHGTLSAETVDAHDWRTGPHPLGCDDGDDVWDLEEIGYRFLFEVPARWLDLDDEQRLEMKFDLEDGAVLHLWIEGPGTLMIARPPAVPGSVSLDMVTLVRQVTGPATFWALGGIEGATPTLENPIPLWTGGILNGIRVELDGVVQTISFD